MSPIDLSFERPFLRISQEERIFSVTPEICWQNSSGEQQNWRPFEGDISQTRIEGLRLEASHPDFTFIIEVDEENGFAVIRSRIVPTAKEPLFLSEIYWRSERSSGFPDVQELVRRSLPYDVWGGSSEFPMAENAPDNKVEYWRTAIFEAAEPESALTWTVKLPAAWRHRFTVSDGESVLENRIKAEFDSGTLFENDPFALCLQGDFNHTLAGPPSFKVARQAPSSGPFHAGWNSWDHYRLNVTQEDILENLEELKKHDWLRDLVRYVIIDDGWQTRTGDWEPNSKFSMGMDGLAEKIQAAGFIPGMWAAPFFAEAGSQIFDKHPEFFVQHEGAPYHPFAMIGCGPPWGDRAYLDPTRTEVADHIYQLWRKFYNWGFRYFKTDFLANPWKLPSKEGEAADKAEPDESGTLQLHNSALGIHRGHRRCMSAIRSAIGEESFWLGCGSIWATGAGLMDASRVSGDIHINWKSLVKCGRNAFLNQHAHGRLWLNDPDFLVVRGKDTGTPDQIADFAHENLNASKPKYPDAFTLDESRMWAALVTLSGGMVVLSDRIKWLNEAGLEILKTIAPRFSGAPGKVLFWEGDLPRVVIQDSPKGRLLGLFNWTDSEKLPLSADEASSLPSGKWRNLWSDQQLSSGSALSESGLAPHSCALLESL